MYLTVFRNCLFTVLEKSQGKYLISPHNEAYKVLLHGHMLCVYRSIGLYAQVCK